MVPRPTNQRQKPVLQENERDKKPSQQSGLKQFTLSVFWQNSPQFKKEVQNTDIDLEKVEKPHLVSTELSCDNLKTEKAQKFSDVYKDTEMNDESVMTQKLSRNTQTLTESSNLNKSVGNCMDIDNDVQMIANSTEIEIVNLKSSSSNNKTPKLTGNHGKATSGTTEVLAEVLDVEFSVTKQSPMRKDVSSVECKTSPSKRKSEKFAYTESPLAKRNSSPASPQAQIRLSPSVQQVYKSQRSPLAQKVSSKLLKWSPVANEGSPCVRHVSQAAEDIMPYSESLLAEKVADPNSPISPQTQSRLSKFIRKESPVFNGKSSPLAHKLLSKGVKYSLLLKERSPNIRHVQQAVEDMTLCGNKSSPIIILDDCLGTNLVESNKETFHNSFSDPEVHDSSAAESCLANQLTTETGSPNYNSCTSTSLDDDTLSVGSETSSLKFSTPLLMNMDIDPKAKASTTASSITNVGSLQERDSSLNDKVDLSTPLTKKTQPFAIIDLVTPLAEKDPPSKIIDSVTPSAKRDCLSRIVINLVTPPPTISPSPVLADSEVQIAITAPDLEKAEMKPQILSLETAAQVTVKETIGKESPPSCMIDLQAPVNQTTLTLADSKSLSNSTVSERIEEKLSSTLTRAECQKQENNAAKKILLQPSITKVTDSINKDGKLEDTMKPDKNKECHPRRRKRETGKNNIFSDIKVDSAESPTKRRKIVSLPICLY